jgi:TetR/AcrR family transcriptional repressor of mexJK operon
MRRSRILRAAATLFLEKGYAGVSMTDVLALVGGSKSTLYRYFEDKENLFKAAVEMLVDERFRPLRAIRPGDCGVAETLTEFGFNFAGTMLAPEAIALYRLITAETDRVSPIGRTFFDQGIHFGSEMMGDYLRGRCASGELALADPMLAGAQLYHAMLGAPHMRLLGDAPPPTPEEIEAGISHAVETFLAGALPR